MRQRWAAAACGASAGSVHHPQSPGKSCSRWQGVHLSGPQTGGGSGRLPLQPAPTSPFLSRTPFCSFFSLYPQTQVTPTRSGNSRPPATGKCPQSATYFMVGEGLTLLLHKAVQERERDEAEENDKENSTADHSLRLWAVKE